MSAGQPVTGEVVGRGGSTSLDGARPGAGAGPGAAGTLVHQPAFTRGWCFLAMRCHGSLYVSAGPNGLGEFHEAMGRQDVGVFNAASMGQ